MIKQIIYSIRNFKRRPLLLFISVPGLALGITGFLMLTIYLQHELNYDKHFATRKRVVISSPRIIKQQPTPFASEKPIPKFRNKYLK